VRYIKNNPYYQLRLLKGEEIITTLTAFVKEKKLKSGVLIGLGAGTDLELGSYNLKKQRYHRRRFKGEYEICSLVGNIAWADNEPVLHIHTVISNERFTTYSGHLFASYVAATVEIAIIPGEKKILRQLEPDTGLKLLQL